jgi:hypothetical protein
MAHRVDAWLDAIPEDVYDPCPCGCGKAFRHVAKGGEEVLAEHEERFYRRVLAAASGEKDGIQAVSGSSAAVLRREVL